jgi:hypothetical protein
MLKQGSRLRPQAQKAQAVAGVVVGDTPIVARAERAQAQHIHQIFGQLVGSADQLLGGGLVQCVVEQLVIQVFDHRGAGAGGQHYIALTAQQLDCASSHGACLIAEAGVEAHLAAAGQPARHMNRAALGLQQRSGRQPDIWVDLIDNAGDEQCDAARLH